MAVNEERHFLDMSFDPKPFTSDECDDIVQGIALAKESVCTMGEPNVRSSRLNRWRTLGQAKVRCLSGCEEMHGPLVGDGVGSDVAGRDEGGQLRTRGCSVSSTQSELVCEATAEVEAASPMVEQATTAEVEADVDATEVGGVGHDRARAYKVFNEVTQNVYFVDRPATFKTLLRD
mmetsp:Transcript_95855/g.309163  ORF Transcript_95855/g.309163 Transcript_95855/m.309163 type:complete len:176 (-) Transcript_95855:592-1119(-)